MAATLTPQEAEAQHARLASEVRNHKRAIARHRDELHHAKAALTAFEDHIRALGLRLVRVPVHPQTGEGDIHGHRPDPDPDAS